MAETEESKDEEWYPVRYFGRMAPRFLSPTVLLRDVERIMNSFDEEFYGPLWPSMLTSPPRFPAIDVKEEDDKYVVIADLPGLTKEEVNVHVGEGVLDISAKREKVSEEEKEGYVRRERGHFSFHRRLALPEDADEEGVDAKLEDGVLKLTIPRRAKEAKELRKKVEVK